MSGPLISATGLAAAIADPDLVVLDATVVLPPAADDGPGAARSGAAHFAEGHLPGARHAYLLGALADPSRGFRFAQPAPAVLAAALAAVGVGARTRVVAYDDDGTMWAARLWGAAAIGHDRAQVLDGGLAAWFAAGGAIERGPAGQLSPPTDPIYPVTGRGGFVGRDDVLDVVAGRRRAQLVCTLGADTFAGRAPSRYTRAGHIPGSSNLPARRLTRADGRLLDAHEREARLAPILGDPRPVILYCGGGISASLVALILTLAGRDDVSVYDGSLEEWSADPALPLDRPYDPCGAASGARGHAPHRRPRTAQVLLLAARAGPGARRTLAERDGRRVRVDPGSDRLRQVHALLAADGH